MAAHIASVAEGGLAEMDKAAFYAACRGGDMCFCSGADGISVVIEKEQNSPFSHVLMLWVPQWSTEWLTLESTLDRGVHVGKFSDYVDSYRGRLVLARRPELSQAQIVAELNAGFSLLDYKYDWIEELSMAARKLPGLENLPVLKPKDELYCSGLMQAIAAGVQPYAIAGPDWATPEQIWRDPSVQAVGALAPGKNASATQRLAAQ